MKDWGVCFKPNAMLSSVSPGRAVWKQLIVQTFGTVAATAHKTHMSVKAHGPHQTLHTFCICTFSGGYLRRRYGFQHAVGRAGIKLSSCDGRQKCIQRYIQVMGCLGDQHLKIAVWHSKFVGQAICDSHLHACHKCVLCISILVHAHLLSWCKPADQELGCCWELWAD